MRNGAATECDCRGPYWLVIVATSCMCHLAKECRVFSAAQPRDAGALLIRSTAEQRLSPCHTVLDGYERLQAGRH